MIGISETWLNDTTQDLVNLPGYSFLSNHRTTKPGGGVGLYLQNDFEYKVLPESNFSDPDVIESLFVEINVPNGKKNYSGYSLSTTKSTSTVIFGKVQPNPHKRFKI